MENKYFNGRNDFLSAVYNSVEEVVLIIDKEFRIQSVNRKGMEFFGDEDPTGRKCYDIICERESPVDDCPLKCRLRGEEPGSGRIIKTRGRFFEVKTTALHSENDEIVGFVDILHDVTSFRETEERLRTARNEYRELNQKYLENIDELSDKNEQIRLEKLELEMLFNNMNSAFALHEIILNREGVPYDYRFINCNALFEEYTGLKKDLILGKTVREVLPAIEDVWIEAYGKVALEGTPVCFTNYSRDLSKYYEVNAYSPRKGFFATTFLDISKRIRYEQDLKCRNEEYEQVNKENTENLEEIRQINFRLEELVEIVSGKEQLLQAIFNQTPSIVILMDKSLRVTQVNHAGIASFGIDNESVKGMKLGKILRCINAVTDPDACATTQNCLYCTVKESIQMTLKTGKAVVKSETDITMLKRGKRQEVYYFLLSTSLVKSKEETNILLTLDDITDRKKTEVELNKARIKAENSDRLKTSFLVNMSHEIRTPLNGIMGFSEILTSRNDLSEDQKGTFVSIIKKSSNSLLQIVNDILDLSTLESGNFEIVPDNFNLPDMINDLYSIFTQKIMEINKNLTIRKRESEPEIYCIADEQRLRQVFTNILDNAIKFTDEGYIEFGIFESRDDGVVFFVKDTGIGIKENDQKVIFDRFRQAELNSNRLYGGNGLGLSIVKEIIRLMSGEIWLESAPGKGSTFYFSLPWKSKDYREEDRSEDSTVKEQKLDELKILVVEDDETNMFFLREILESKGSFITYCTTGMEAVHEAKAIGFDLILMDIRLPDINGLEAVRQIREFDKNVYIIAQTAYAMKADEKLSLQSGCDDYISKPINQEFLFGKINKCASLRKV